jgi:hypothetical protein
VAHSANSLDQLKKIIYITIGCAGSVPLLAWIASLIFHWVNFGQPFVFNQMAYMPLLVVCRPLLAIGRIGFRETHVDYFLLAAKASIIFGGIAFLALCPILFALRRRARGG